MEDFRPSEVGLPNTTPGNVQCSKQDTSPALDDTGGASKSVLAAGARRRREPRESVRERSATRMETEAGGAWYVVDGW